MCAHFEDEKVYTTGQVTATGPSIIAVGCGYRCKRDTLLTTTSHACQ